MRWLSSYLQHDSRDTQYTDRARRIRFDEFSALRHGDVVIVRTFVGSVLSCKSTLDVGTIQKTICAPARQLEYSLSEKCCFRLFRQRVRRYCLIRFSSVTDRVLRY
jgi:hypothetical protein